MVQISCVYNSPKPCVKILETNLKDGATSSRLGIPLQSIECWLDLMVQSSLFGFLIT